MIPLSEMNDTMKKVAKYMAIAEAATRKAKEEMAAMFARHKGKESRHEKLTVIRGGKR